MDLTQSSTPSSVRNPNGLLKALKETDNVNRRRFREEFLNLINQDITNNLRMSGEAHFQTESGSNSTGNAAECNE